MVLVLYVLNELIKVSSNIMLPVLRIFEDVKLVLKVHEELLTSAPSNIIIATLKKLEERILIFKVIRGLMPSLEIVPLRRKIL